MNYASGSYIWCPGKIPVSAIQLSWSWTGGFASLWSGGECDWIPRAEIVRNVPEPSVLPVEDTRFNFARVPFLMAWMLWACLSCERGGGWNSPVSCRWLQGVSMLGLFWFIRNSASQKLIFWRLGCCHWEPACIKAWRKMQLSGSMQID